MKHIILTAEKLEPVKARLRQLIPYELEVYDRKGKLIDDGVKVKRDDRVRLDLRLDRTKNTSVSVKEYEVDGVMGYVITFNPNLIRDDADLEKGILFVEDTVCALAP